MKQYLQNIVDYLQEWWEDHGDVLFEFVVAFLMTVLILIACFGCASEKVVVRTEYNYKDSTIVHTTYDTTHIIVQDTVRVEIESNTTTDEGMLITFGEGGGSYNANTGEYNNVASIKQNKKEESNSRLSAEWQHTAEQWKATADSLQAELSTIQQSEDKESQKNTADIRPKTSGWHRFLVWWFWITLVVALLFCLWKVADYVPQLKAAKTAVKLFLRI